MKILTEIPVQKKVRIVDIFGGRNARQTLAQMGIGVGSQVIVRRNAPFSGPILVENHGTTVAIGRGLASKIMVEEI